MRKAIFICFILALSPTSPVIAASQDAGAVSEPASPATPAKRPPPAAYPPALFGQWEPIAGPCRLPLNYDSDGGFKIGRRLLRGYEHTDTPTKVQRISTSPAAWRIEAVENYGGEKTRVLDLYVLKGDSLTVTDGERSTRYTRCR